MKNLSSKLHTNCLRMHGMQKAPSISISLLPHTVRRGNPRLPYPYPLLHLSFPSHFPRLLLNSITPCFIMLLMVWAGTTPILTWDLYPSKRQCWHRLLFSCMSRQFVWAWSTILQSLVVQNRDDAQGNSFIVMTADTKQLCSGDTNRCHMT